MTSLKTFQLMVRRLFYILGFKPEESTQELLLVIIEVLTIPQTGQRTKPRQHKAIVKPNISGRRAGMMMTQQMTFLHNSSTYRNLSWWELEFGGSCCDSRHNPSIPSIPKDKTRQRKIKLTDTCREELKKVESAKRRWEIYKDKWAWLGILHGRMKSTACFFSFHDSVQIKRESITNHRLKINNLIMGEW